MGQNIQACCRKTTTQIKDFYTQLLIIQLMIIYKEIFFCSALMFLDRHSLHAPFKCLHRLIKLSSEYCLKLIPDLVMSFVICLELVNVNSQHCPQDTSTVFVIRGQKADRVISAILEHDNVVVFVFVLWKEAYVTYSQTNLQHCKTTEKRTKNKHGAITRCSLKYSGITRCRFKGHKKRF